MTLHLTYANFLMIQFNWSFSDFSNFGKISPKNEILNINFRSFQQSKFCGINRFIVRLSETQYLHAKIEYNFKI